MLIITVILNRYVLLSAHFHFLQCVQTITFKEQQVDSPTDMKPLAETLNQSKMMKRKQQVNFQPPKPKMTDSQASSLTLCVFPGQLLP